MSTHTRVTGADVARAAGVSRATVSYVLNDTPGQTIPEETRLKVRAAATELGYVPHMAGRTLRRGRSDLVVLVLPNWPMGSVVGEMIEELSAAAAARRHTLAIMRESEGPEALAGAIRTLAPAAIIRLDELPEAIRDMAEAGGIPVVAALHAQGPSEGLTDLAESQRRVGHLQVQHLAAQGHRRISILSPADERVRVFGDARRAGAMEACLELGLDAPLVAVLPLDRAQLRETALRWKAEGITAVCAYNDEWAMGLLSGMAMTGLSAPGDLAVIGCDDIPTAPVASPPLTTIRQDMHTYTARAMDEVARLLGEPFEPVRIDSSMYQLVVRESA